MKIIKTAPSKPPRIIVYGEHKIGKSTFGKGCPKPIFIQTEDGLESLGVEAFERCKSYENVIECLEHLVKEQHDYKTVVLDSLDWCEKLIWEKICKDNNWSQIGDGPYGAGYKLAINYWRNLLKAFDVLNTEKKMLVVLIAHAKISKFEDPSTENFDRYGLDLHEKSGKMICEYVDIIGFANLKTMAVKKKEGFGQETVKVKTTGERQLNLTARAAYEAGNRYNLPDSIDLSWEALSKEIAKYFANQKEGNLSVVVADKEAKKAAKEETK
ncbi:MAG TPA: ATP-binding protein [Nitrosomonas sp.]|nr:ATP-binding protein [Nitrosomonas sp.]